ncbi:MAG: hypothetical protein JWN70_1449 [Planctomycetaceae bacterium]|nr:hypothetical protein [Planctomycetaceae bacterium]
MKLVCTPVVALLPTRSDSTLPVLLYGRSDGKSSVSIGAAINEDLNRRGFAVNSTMRDLLSLALSVIAADVAVLKPKSADGWTREIELVVSVSEPDRWNTKCDLIEQILRFLTTDIWKVSFVKCDHQFELPKHVTKSSSEVISLLSGGIDSLVGALDLTADGLRPLVVSQTVTGDADKQVKFAREIAGGLEHLQLNHNVHWAETNDKNQRARSFIFLTYGILAATCTEAYDEGKPIILYVCENGLISINPPLTATRVGSLSTRTTHPVFISLLQRLLHELGFRVLLKNPYQYKTKGEMLAECRDQQYLLANAHLATSCGRYRRNGFKHCGRCVPCLIRRAAFYRWPLQDQSIYVYSNLGLSDSNHSGFDDVRSAAMAVAELDELGINRILGSSLSSSLVLDVDSLRSVAERGLREVGAFLFNAGVK